MKPIDPDLLPKLCSAADLLPTPYRLAWYLALEAGLRIGEITKLAWCDLVHQNKPLSAIRLDAAITKRHVERTIPITRALAAEIQHAWNNSAHPNGYSPAHYAMAKHPDGKPLDARSIQRRFAALGRREIGYPINPHDLRHTYAKRLLAVSDLPTVQAALGHRRINTTAIYTRQGLAEIRVATDKLPNPHHHP